MIVRGADISEHWFVNFLRKNVEFCARPLKIATFLLKKGPPQIGC